LLGLQPQITDAEQRADVARVLREDLLVLLDSLVVALLLDKLLGCLGYLFAIDRHSDLIREAQHHEERSASAASR
jgi:hypothetical protein